MKRTLNPRFLVIFLSTTLIFLTSCGKESSAPAVQSNGSMAVLTVSDSPLYDFGLHDINVPTDKTLYVSNIGAGEATQITGSFFLSLSFSFKDGAYPGTGATCTDYLSSLSMCTVVVTFTPKFTGVTETAVAISYFNGTKTVTTSMPTLHGQGN